MLFLCPVCGYVEEYDGDELPADFACPVCKVPGSKFIKQAPAEEGGEALNWASEHVVGVGTLDEVPADLQDFLRAEYNGECSEAGMYLAMARAAYREGYPEVGAYYETAAWEEAGHAARYAEMIGGEIVSDSTEENLKRRVAAENGACKAKTDMAKKAKQLNLDALHDSIHEMARDEARHGQAFQGLLKRYFG